MLIHARILRRKLLFAPLSKLLNGLLTPLMKENRAVRVRLVLSRPYISFPRRVGSGVFTLHPISRSATIGHTWPLSLSLSLVCCYSAISSPPLRTFSLPSFLPCSACGALNKILYPRSRESFAIPSVSLPGYNIYGKFHSRVSRVFTAVRQTCLPRTHPVASLP